MDESNFHDQFYDADAERIFSSPLYLALRTLHARFLLDATPRAAEARILSIGCGDGYREIDLAPHVGRIVGVDVSTVAIDRARRRAAALAIDNVEFRVEGIGTAVSCWSTPFDAVWCAGVLHHLSDREIVASLASLHAALRPGGRFIAMEPNAHRAVKLFKPLLRRRYERYHSPGERELRPGAIVEMLQRASFRAIEVRFTDFFISPLAWSLPRLPAPLVPLLTRLDQRLVRFPIVNALASGFAILADPDE